MKKFTQICLILALVLVLVGGSICIVGGAAGGFELIRNMSDDSIMFGKMGSVEHIVQNILPGHWWNEGNSEMRENLREDMQEMSEEAAMDVQDEMEKGLEELEELEEIHNLEYAEDYEDYEYYDDYEDSVEARRQDDILEEYTLTSSDQDTKIELLQMQRLYVTIGGAAIYIKPSEDDMIYLEKSGRGKYKCYVSDSALYVEGNKNNTKWMGVNNEKVYLYLPEGMDWKKIDIMVGGGMLNANELSADQIVIQGGAGAISIDHITCSRLSAEVGAGTMNLGDVQAAELDVSVGVGYAAAAGKITDKIDIECGLGSVDLELDGSQDDYNYNLDCNAGTIRIGEHSYSSPGDKKMNNGARAVCDLQCAMGSLDVSFSE